MRLTSLARGGGCGWSGGLLLAVGPGRRDGLRRELAGRGVPHREIGRLTDGPAGRIVVTA